MTSLSYHVFRKDSLTRSHKAGYQKHHLIPVQIFRKASFYKLFERARLGGFDSRDFKTNGIYLPANEILAIETGMPLHRGPHPQYNAMVSERLSALIPTKLEKNSNQILAHQILSIQKSLRQLLMDTPSKIQLNKRDPMSRNVDFSFLDAEVDRLWAAIEQK